MTPFCSFSNRFQDMNNSLNSQYYDVVKITLLYPNLKNSWEQGIFDLTNTNPEKNAELAKPIFLSKNLILVTKSSKTHNLLKLTLSSSISNKLRDMRNSLNSHYYDVVKFTILDQSLNKKMRVAYFRLY